MRRRRSIATNGGFDNHWSIGNPSNGKHQEKHTLSAKASVSKVPYNEKPRTANIKLQAFGRPLNLSLVKNEDLFKKTGLKIWTVEPNATSQHGVEYVEMPQHVSKNYFYLYTKKNYYGS